MNTNQARNWLCTLNNPDVTMSEAYLKKWKDYSDCLYVNGQLEKGEQGTIHLQYFLHFKTNKRMAALKKVCGQSHYQSVKIDNGASDYCMKVDTRVDGPWEIGVKPARKNVKGSTAERNKQIIELGAEKCVEEGLIHVKEYMKIKQCIQTYKLHTHVRVDHPDVRGYWYWGEPGTGKSETARSEGDYYLKAQNKWWDGYNGESIVILDDLDTTSLGHLLKIWADRYFCPGEVKGGTIPLRHTKFIVTSNHTIESLFKEDHHMVDAIRRRFRVT